MTGLSVWFGLAGGILGEVLGGWDGFLICLTAFVIIDYLTGVLAAAQQGKLASSQGFKGILRKIMIFLVVGMGHLLDQSLLGGSGEPLRSAMIFFYLSNEGLSIIENLGQLGVPIPRRLRRLVAELGDEDEPA